MKEISDWNGFPVLGDVGEIDAIISTPGLIALDKNDIVSILEAEGEAFIVSGIGATMDAALDAALDNLHIGKETITDLAIALWGTEQVPMSAMSVISDFTSTLDPEASVVWGFYTDDTLADNFKIVLIGDANR